MTIDQQTLTVICAVFMGGFMVAGWLEFRFRQIEKLIYREMHSIRKETSENFDDHSTRLQRAELKLFGFTNTGRSSNSN